MAIILVTFCVGEIIGKSFPAEREINPTGMTALFMSISGKIVTMVTYFSVLIQRPGTIDDAFQAYF